MTVISESRWCAVPGRQAALLLAPYNISAGFSSTRLSRQMMAIGPDGLDAFLAGNADLIEALNLKRDLWAGVVPRRVRLEVEYGEYPQVFYMEGERRVMQIRPTRWLSWRRVICENKPTDYEVLAAIYSKTTSYFAALVGPEKTQQDADWIWRASNGMSGRVPARFRIDMTTNAMLGVNAKRAALDALCPGSEGISYDEAEYDVGGLARARAEIDLLLGGK